MKNLIIETQHLTKRYGEQIIVEDINLHVKQGRIYGLLGKNGAGKTTIMKMLLGLTPISTGNAYLFQQDIRKNRKAIYPRVGALIEGPGFYPNLTGRENLEVFAKLRGTTDDKAVQRALEIVGLPYKDKKTFAHYSMGMKQRLGIACAVLHDPELLILDEPTNGLDPVGIAEIRKFLKELCAVHGKTLLLSSHILSEIAVLADDVGIIDNGRLLEERTMEELKKINQKYICLNVSNAEKADLILENNSQIGNYRVVSDRKIHIYHCTLPLSALNQILVNDGIQVAGLSVGGDTLEDYFKKRIGGGQDAESDRN